MLFRSVRAAEPRVRQTAVRMASFFVVATVTASQVIHTQCSLSNSIIQFPFADNILFDVQVGERSVGTGTAAVATAGGGGGEGGDVPRALHAHRTSGQPSFAGVLMSMPPNRTDRKGVGRVEGRGLLQREQQQQRASY